MVPKVWINEEYLEPGRLELSNLLKWLNGFPQKWAHLMCRLNSRKDVSKVTRFLFHWYDSECFLVSIWFSPSLMSIAATNGHQPGAKQVLNIQAAIQHTFPSHEICWVLRSVPSTTKSLRKKAHEASLCWTFDMLTLKCGDTCKCVRSLINFLIEWRSWRKFAAWAGKILLLTSRENVQKSLDARY